MLSEDAYETHRNQQPKQGGAKQTSKGYQKIRQLLQGKDYKNDQSTNLPNIHSRNNTLSADVLRQYGSSKSIQSLKYGGNFKSGKLLGD